MKRLGVVWMVLLHSLVTRWYWTWLYMDFPAPILLWSERQKSYCPAPWRKVCVLIAFYDRSLPGQWSKWCLYLIHHLLFKPKRKVCGVPNHFQQIWRINFFIFFCPHTPNKFRWLDSPETETDKPTNMRYGKLRKSPDINATEGMIPDIKRCDMVVTCLLLWAAAQQLLSNFPERGTRAYMRTSISAN